MTFESFLSGWFLGADCSELKRGNLVVFLAWTLYAKEVDALSKAERKNVMAMVGGTRWGCSHVLHASFVRLLSPREGGGISCA